MVRALNTDNDTIVPRLTTSKKNRARALLRDGKLVAAATLFEEITRFDPGAGYVWLEYGDALTELGRYDEAYHAYESALEYAPPDKKSSVYTRMGMLIEEWQGIEPAAKYFEDAVTYNTEPADWILIQCGNNLAKRGRVDRAEEMFIEATTLKSDMCSEAYLNLALLYRSAKRYEESVEMARKSLEIDSGCPRARKVIRSLEYDK